MAARAARGGPRRRRRWRQRRRWQGQRWLRRRRPRTRAWGRKSNVGRSVAVLVAARGGDYGGHGSSVAPRGDERRAQSSSLATTMAATVVCHRRRQRWRRRQRHWRQRRPCPSVECCADACLRTRGEGARMEGKAGVRDRRRVAHTCRINQAGGRWAGGHCVREGESDESLRCDSCGEPRCAAVCHGVPP